MLTDQMKAQLKNLLVDHESYENFPYIDTVGKITIGIGYNLTDRGLPDAWINQQFDEDVNYFHSQMLADFPWYAELNQARQMALIDMCFMGYKRFKEFVKMLDALAEKNYQLAAHEMLASVWASQVKGRAQQLAHIMISGAIE